MKRITLVLKWIIVIYVIFLTLLYFNQEMLLFFPDPLPKTHKYRTGEEVKIEVEDGVGLSCVLLPSNDKEKFLIYFHGNKGNNRRCIHQAMMFYDTGYNIIMPDYRGYGKSDGEMESESQVLSDIQHIYDYVVNTYNPKKIVIVGYSLGTGMASYIAAHNRVDQLFLIAPYTSLSDVKDYRMIPVPDCMMKYDLSTKEYLKDIECPVTIFHAPNDRVIPYECSSLLKKRYNNKIDFITIPNGNHRSSIFSSEVKDAFNRKTIPSLYEKTSRK